MGDTLEPVEVNLRILEKTKVSNRSLNRSRQVGLALIALCSQAARERHERLKLHEEIFRRASAARSAINLNDSNRRAQRLGKFVSISADGMVASVAITDPGLALTLPRKTSLDSTDPVAYAVKVIPALERGTEEHRAMASVLRGGVHTFYAAQKAHQQAQKDRAAADRGAENAGLDLDAYVSDCLKFINDAAPKDHDAHQLKKPKRKTKAASPEPAKTDDVKPESSATAQGAGLAQ